MKPLWKTYAYIKAISAIEILRTPLIGYDADMRVDPSDVTTSTRK